MKVNYEKAMKVNNELKINVDEQYVDMKNVKENYNVDDEDEVKYIKGAGTTIKH